MRHNLTRSIFRVLSLLAPLVAVTSCYQDAVSEKLLIEFTRDGLVQLTSVVEFLDVSETKNPALRQRVINLRVEYEREQDPWSRRFANLYSLKDRYVREREEDDLLRIERSSQTTLSVLASFFTDTSITVSVIEGTGWREVAFYSGMSTRASQQQRGVVARSLDEWSRNVSLYLSATEKLYKYSAAHPDRAPHLIGTVMEDFLPDERKKSLQLADDEERDLVAAVQERMEPVLSSLRTAENEAYSLDELSSLVYDPFPAEVTVRVPGAILEVEGFELIPTTNSLRVPKLRLWDALESLQERWIAPDLLVAYVNAARAGSERFNLDKFLEQERIVKEIPTETAVRIAVEQRLARKSGYRVRWQTGPLTSGISGGPSSV